MSCSGRKHQFQKKSSAGKPQVVSRYILSNLGLQPVQNQGTWRWVITIEI
jgi:hypothetical protein